MNIFKKKSGTVFGCFSPPVMIATFVIEIAFAIYAFAKHRDKLWGKTITLILVCLAIFQLAEYQVCGGYDQLIWARVGYMAITLLPPLGITLTHIIAKKPLNTLLHKLSWILAAYFIFAYAFSPVSELTPVCNGNYVIFKYKYALTNWMIFGPYYFGLLFAGIYASYRWNKKSDKLTKDLSKALIVGYSVFIVPTLLINLADPSTVHGIPSIMCGFAVILAFVLTMYIRPNLAKRL